ncbi:hypothetical protein HaLaN_14457 [Haematococcus lacustris]|uniref:Uncharacterized protein n=1 Tax=Haematococcus lacustris TaxID=44745 RepID=A0A699Z8K6_HAELA|nr:hypothetical protein HaLaN_14457 [Haematococcus lacustris]
MAAPSPDDPNALGSDGLPKFARTTTQTFGEKESTVAQLDKEAGRHRKSSSQEQQVGSAWSVSLDFRCRQLEHDMCSMAWWLQARPRRRRAAANKEVARKCRWCSHPGIPGQQLQVRSEGKPGRGASPGHASVGRPPSCHGPRLPCKPWAGSGWGCQEACPALTAGSQAAKGSQWARPHPPLASHWRASPGWSAATAAAEACLHLLLSGLPAAGPAAHGLPAAGPAARFDLGLLGSGGPSCTLCGDAMIAQSSAAGNTIGAAGSTTCSMALPGSGNGSPSCSRLPSGSWWSTPPHTAGSLTVAGGRGWLVLVRAAAEGTAGLCARQRPSHTCMSKLHMDMAVLARWFVLSVLGNRVRLGRGLGLSGNAAGVGVFGRQLLP